VEVVARVVLTAHGAVEGPDCVVGLAGLGWRPDIDGLCDPVALGRRV